MSRRHIVWEPEQIEAVRNNSIPPGKNYGQCAYYARKYLGQRFLPVKSVEDAARNERGRKYYEMYLSGKTYTDIAKEVGLSRQRVHIIVQKWLDRNNVKKPRRHRKAPEPIIIVGRKRRRRGN